MKRATPAGIVPAISGYEPDYEQNAHCNDCQPVMAQPIRWEARRPLLDTLRTQGVDLPYGCKYGGCITCAAKLVAGDVDQRRQVALNNRQINNGYVLLCVAPSNNRYHA